METREWTFRDRSTWQSGPWDTEPDKRQWQDKATGLPCLIVRGHNGALCGYVGVSKTHPYFGVRFNKCGDLDVHGGLTFSDRCSGEDHGICHVVPPEEDDHVWWLGFDMQHSMDRVPAWKEFGGEYRDFPYVAHECTRLAAQLAEVANGTVRETTA